MLCYCFLNDAFIGVNTPNGKKFHENLFALFSGRKNRGAYAEAMFILISAGLLFFVAGWILSLYQKLSHYRSGAFQMWNALVSEVMRRRELLSRLTDWISVCMARDVPMIQELVRENENGFSFLSGEESAFDILSEKRFRESEHVLQRSLEGFFRELNDHPELKNELPVSQLRHELSLSAIRIHRALYVYNAAAKEYNAMMEAFPASMVAQLFRMKFAVPLQNMEGE